MKNFKIVHLAPTPLVGSPAKISYFLNRYFDSTCIIFQDYPTPLKGLFSNEAILFDKFEDISSKLIASANIIHIHNFLTKRQEDIVLSISNDDVRFIYQVHSPLKEGPLFSEYVKGSKIDYDIKLVIGQYQPRLYSDYIVVPNIVTYKPSIKLVEDNEKPKIVFSPSHKRVGSRWSDKISEELNETLKALKKMRLIELINLSGISPYTLYQYRRNSHISIDEINSGGYHQTSLEGLCMGNVVINNSDIFSDLVLARLINSNEEIPFFKVNNYDVYEKLFHLVKNKDLIREYQKKSFDFFTKYLMPNKLIKSYIRIYKELCDL